MLTLRTRTSLTFSLVALLALALAAGCDDSPSGKNGARDTLAGDGSHGDGTGGGDSAGGDGTSQDTASTDSAGLDTTSGDTHGDGSVEDGTDGSAPIPGLTSLEVTPADTVLTADPADPVGQTVQLTATGHFDDGSTRDVTGEVSWYASNGAIGSIGVSTGLFTSTNLAGGTAQVVARAGALEGAATVSVILVGDVNDPQSGTLPGDLDALFDPQANTLDAATGPHRPAIVYPSHETMFPRNIHLILFQWQTGTDNDVFRLSFDSATTHLAIFTDQDRWSASEAVWKWLAYSNPGQAVTVQLQAVDTANPGTVYVSDAITIYFSASDVQGAIYYWSTGAEAVMKGLPGSATPEQFWSTPSDGTCVACHTVSRDGRRLLMGYGGEKLQEVTIPDRSIKIDVGRYAIAWGTFSPDGTKILFARDGKLRLIDADTGDPIGANDGLLDLGGYAANHPDWSPNGDYVAMAVILSDKIGNKGFKGSSIARIPYNDGAWGAVEILLQSTGDTDTNYFPMYSPDSHYLAFAHAAEDCKDAPTAAIRLMTSDGLQGPVELERLNHRVNQTDGVVNIGNSMPTWAPTTVPGVQWLAFSSLRDYGKVLVGTERDQIWIAAVTPELFGSADASYPAFWAPFQDPAESNHRAFWAHDASQTCNSTVELCDELDNDCDGVVDEDCLPCGDAELCGDDLDNDCNGLVDDQCFSCDPTEVCDDLIDNDCNGQVDEGCSSCDPIEACGDNVDNNCNGLIDEGCFTCGDAEICFDLVDNDCDGQLDEDCGNCGAEELCWNGLDDDCNGVIDDGCYN